jgi:peptidyl-prolyl cis-trans isomerase D
MNIEKDTMRLVKKQEKVLFCGSKSNLTLEKGIMALINKIREKSGVAVVVIAAGLLLFILGGDDLVSLIQGSSTRASQEIGEIAGNPIMAQEFAVKLDEAKKSFEMQSGRTSSEAETQSLKEQIWNQYVVDYAYKKEFEALGLKVSNEELVDMVQGNNISPIIKSNFSNPQTRDFDKTAVIRYLKDLKKLPIEQQQQWEKFEQSLAQSRLVTKYENLMLKSGYVTKAEAEKQYQSETTKASLRYLYVPFYSVADTTIKVTDSQLSDYLSKHKEEFTGYDSRSLEYVSFPVLPSKDDSAALYNKIRELAKVMGNPTTNDSTFTRANSDVPTKLYWSLPEMPESLRNSIKSLIVGSPQGPFKEGNTYFIYKYLGTKKDTTFTAKASHILITKQGLSDSAKIEARNKAEGLLKKLKAGESFEALALSNSQDQGSAQRGGDLGYFRKGQMVKPFDAAVFAASGTGLLPSIVESEFGYHIIKVTDAKSNTLYKVSVIGKTLSASQMTRDAAYTKADQFALSAKTKAQFEEMAKKEKLAVQTASRVAEGSTNINTIANAREIANWAFANDTKTDKVSSVFDADEQFVVATLTGKTEKSNPTIEDFREQLQTKVRNAAKAEQITAKLNTINTATLDATAQKYGAGALVETANDISLATGFLTSAGMDPIALGKGFALKAGKKSKVFTGDNGVFIMEQIGSLPAPVIADYTTYKNNLLSRSTQSQYSISEAIKSNAKITDNRAKF